MIFSKQKKLQMPSQAEALPGRSERMPLEKVHYVTGNAMSAPYPEGFERAMFGLGCFWGAERKFWEQTGTYITAVGYAGGFTPNPLYEEVCTGMTGHNEVVLVVFDPEAVTYMSLLKQFWESHNPTQGMRQGNDTGTQYRSGIYYFTDSQKQLAIQTRSDYQTKLDEAGLGSITTEIIQAPEFYYAEPYHQQYLAKNPSGYCGLGGTGISY